MRRFLPLVLAAVLPLVLAAVLGVTAVGAAAPAGAATYPCRPGQTLKIGQYNSTCVKALQTYLNGYIDADLVLDGDFGPKTQTAVKAYQREARLAQIDGIVGPRTRDAIAARGGIPVNSGATDAQIRAAGAAWQNMVLGWGYPLD